jgi:hypothetical protein
MSWPAEELLAGPRGRRLCWSLLDAGDYPGWERVQRGAMAGDLSGLLGELAASVARTDVDVIGATTDELALLAGLAESVVWAMYWQEPDAADQALADPAVREALMPVARAPAGTPTRPTGWPTSLPLQALRPAGWKVRTNHSAGSRPGDQAVGPLPSPTRAGRSSPGRPILLGQASGRGIGVAAEVCCWPWLSPGPFLVPWLTTGDCDLPPRTVDTVTS